MTENVIVRPSYDRRGQNENYEANHILEYQLSTPQNVDVVQETNFAKTRNVGFRPSFDPSG